MLIFKNGDAHDDEFEVIMFYWCTDGVVVWFIFSLSNWIDSFTFFEDSSVVAHTHDDGVVVIDGDGLINGFFFDERSVWIENFDFSSVSDSS